MVWINIRGPLIAAIAMKEDFGHEERTMKAGRKIAGLSGEPRVSDGTLYGWKGNVGGMEVGEAQRLRSLEDRRTVA